MQPLQSGKQAVVLFPTHHGDATKTATHFSACLTNQLREQLEDRVAIIDTLAFQDALFPWFEGARAPSTIDELNALLARDFIRDRIGSLGVRYLVKLDIASASDGFPGIICGAGYGGGGCLGVMWEDKSHKVDVVIWDLVEGFVPVGLSTKTSGRSVGFALGVPILFLANTEKDACKALALELGRLLLNTTM